MFPKDLEGSKKWIPVRALEGVLEFSWVGCGVALSVLVLSSLRLLIMSTRCVPQS